jgi:glycerophosphoryl diester phosphodiesterase
MTKIIGHRGAPGLELENSRASFLAAIKHGVDMIELDVRLTADDKLVVMHDPKTGRVAAENVVVHDKTLAELRAVKLDNDETFLSLDEAFDTIGSTPVIVELKDPGSVDELLLALERHPKAQVTIASFDREELRQVRQVLPDMPIYALEHLAPIDIVHNAHKLGATGIGLNFWLMNPVTYRLAKRYHLEIYVYSVNSPLLARFLHLLYPNIYLCTRHPERFTSPKPKQSPRTPANPPDSKRG